LAFSSLETCALAVGNPISADTANSLSVNARPSIRAARMLARAGSPIKAAIAAMFGHVS